MAHPTFTDRRSAQVGVPGCRLVCCAAVALLLLGLRPDASGAEAESPALQEKLKALVTVEFRKATFLDAVRRLEQLGHLHILVDPDAAATEATITLPRTKMQLGDALRWVARCARLQVVRRHDIILLIRRRGALGALVRCVHDVTDLLPGRGQRGPEPPSRDMDGDTLARFIRHFIAPGTWGQRHEDSLLPGRPAPSIAYRNGRLVVVHIEVVQRQIEALLGHLRKGRNLQVHILARFIEASRDGLNVLKATFHSLPSHGARARETPPSAAAKAEAKESRREPPLRYAHLKDDQVNAFLQALFKQRKGKLLTAPRLTCFNGQRANFQVLTNYGLGRRISSDEEPEIGSAPEGILLDVQPFVSPDGRRITVLLRALIRGVGEDRPAFPAAVTMPDGGTVVLAGRSLDAQLPGGTRGRCLIILLTAQVVTDIFEEE